MSEGGAAARRDLREFRRGFQGSDLELGFLDGGLHLAKWGWRGAFRAEDPASAKNTWCVWK